MNNDEERLSNCCGAPPLYDESDLCSDCKEHTEFLTEAEFEAEENET